MNLNSSLSSNTHAAFLLQVEMEIPNHIFYGKSTLTGVKLMENFV